MLGTLGSLLNSAIVFYSVTRSSFNQVEASIIYRGTVCYDRGIALIDAVVET